jgi:hypothetical protein
MAWRKIRRWGHQTNRSTRRCGQSVLWEGVASGGKQDEASVRVCGKRVWLLKKQAGNEGPRCLFFVKAGCRSGDGCGMQRPRQKQIRHEPSECSECLANNRWIARSAPANGKGGRTGLSLGPSGAGINLVARSLIAMPGNPQANTALVFSAGLPKEEGLHWGHWIGSWVSGVTPAYF